MASEATQEQNERPGDVPGLLEAESDAADSDSTLESGDGSSSYLTSLKSSIFSYRYENGRRYHAFHEGTYLVPNDDEEQNRMDLVHHIYSLVMQGKLHTAPINENPQRVLDLGTGTGIWAIDFADEYPSSEVIGTDLSPIQPDWTPTNCVFEVDDFEDPWVYKRPFDYIHARELEGCIANEDQFFGHAFQNLSSGGYLEMQGQRAYFMSDDESIKNAVNAEVWAVALRESSIKFGKPIDCVTGWKDKMIKAGFVDVHQEIRKIPIGGWPKDPVLKEVGKCQVIQSCAAIDSYTPMLLGKFLGWGQDEVQVLMAKAKKELRDPAIHIYLPVYFIWDCGDWISKTQNKRKRAKHAEVVQTSQNTKLVADSVHNGGDDDESDTDNMNIPEDSLMPEYGDGINVLRSFTPTENETDSGHSLVNHIHVPEHGQPIPLD
ncbi:hypothetical protein HYE68_001612 [Fusarium pseudograminearum]|nr:hypothetical protein HYE68_001612 [Fusarium pseudograminearum]